MDRMTSWLGCVAVVGSLAVGCSSGPDDSGDVVEPGATTAAPPATSVETTPDDTAIVDADDGAATGLTIEQEDDAIGIARAFFVARTDFTSDQFEWRVEAAARDGEGLWWARVSATPLDSAGLETEQIFVHEAFEGRQWLALDMGTGIEPATDERFPEEVRSEL